MKRILWVFAATVICGACLFTSCKKDEETGNSDLRVAEKIIGKWVTADVDGQPLPTNEKKVITFVSTTKAYISAAFNANPEIGAHWFNKMEVAVAIDGNNYVSINTSMLPTTPTNTRRRWRSSPSPPSTTASSRPTAS